jgi:hypothetical protein
VNHLRNCPSCRGAQPGPDGSLGRPLAEVAATERMGRQPCVL